MITQNKFKTVLTFAVMLGVFAVLSGSLQAAEVILEQFDYTAGADLTGAGGTGFSGAWATTSSGTDPLFTVRSWGLSFDPLETAGKSAYRAGGAGRAEAHRVISAASQTALLADGSTIWFSVLYRRTGGNTNNSAFLIGTDTYDMSINGTLSTYAASGEGFGFGTNAGPTISAIAYDESASPIVEDSGVVAVPGLKLIVGRIVWAASGSSDTLTLYDVTDLVTEPTTAIATVSADLDQSAFDLVVLQHNNNTAIFDEIRFGTSFADVSVDPNTPSVQAGSDMITWSDGLVQLAATATDNHIALPGLNLEWTHDAPGGYTVDFNPSANVEDPDVTITKDDDTGDATVVTLTLTATVIGSPQLVASDSVRIDVYDDACEAAKAVPSVEHDSTDVDENCITNLADFAVVAADWLVDYELTGPVEKL